MPDHNEDGDLLSQTQGERLSDEEWIVVGEDSTDDFDEMVDQLCAILSMRLKDLVVSRPLTSQNFLQHGQLKEEININLRDYVIEILKRYRQVHFHFIEHAMHVTLSANKLLQMVLGPDDMEDHPDELNRSKRRVTLTHVPGEGVHLDQKEEEDWIHESTFGISSNPMLGFALCFSALVHDVDHQGVPNSTLVEEEHPLAIQHNDVSVAEQNSLQIAFSLLAKPEFALLRKAIMSNGVDRKNFRKHVIDLVLVTDISNPERMQISQSKWKEAFDFDGHEDHVSDKSDSNSSLGDSFSDISLDILSSMKKQRHSMYAGAMAPSRLRRVQSERFGIRKSLDFGGNALESYSTTTEGQLKLRQDTVLETLMNTADVAHTLQSFDVFVKWNKRLFRELLAAYEAERINWDPTVGWYENQVWFYDAYVIPLAEKLQKCGVFGSRGSTFLCFALENKRQWEVKGEEITLELMRETNHRISQENQETATTFQSLQASSIEVTQPE